MNEYAFNLARRHSIRNEHDLLQQDMFEPEETLTPPSTPPGSPLTQKACFQMLDKVCPEHPLPAECQKFQDVKVALQRKNSNRSSHAVAFQGMNPGEAAAAMAARERGHLNHAQIQRRLTTSKKRTLW